MAMKALPPGLALIPGLALLLAACATTGPTSADAAVRAATLALYAPYQAPAEPPADWDRPIFTADTAALIAAWQAARGEGEPADGLADAGWLCECQDWDAATFAVTISRIAHLSPDAARVSLVVQPVSGSTASQTLLLRREQGHWLIEDLFANTNAGAVDDSRGLRQQLREAVQ